MSAALWLLGTLTTLWLLGGLLSQHVQGLLLLLTGRPRFATAAYDLLVLPGVVLHELSHVVGALLLGIRVISVNLFQFRSLNDARQGEVVVAKADPVRMSLVGAAPLIGGVLVLWLLVRWLDPPAVGFDLAALDQIRPLLSEPLSAIGVYLVFAIANTMFPSAADRQAWWVVGVALAIMGLILYAFGVQPSIPPDWIAQLTQQADQITAALLPVILIDVLILAIVIALEVIVGRISGRRIVYRSSRS